MQLLQRAIALVPGLILDSGAGAGHHGRREGSREDESRGERADSVDEFGGCCDVAAHATVGFTERARDDVDAVHDCAGWLAGSVGLEVEVFGDAGAVWAVHADGVDFVEEGDGAVFVCQVADGFDGADGAAHAVDGFEGDDFGDVEGEGRKLGFEVDQVVVFEDDLFGARVADPLDHGGVVLGVGEDDAVGEFGAESC